MSDGIDPTNPKTDQNTKYRFVPVVRRGYPPGTTFDASAARDSASVATQGTLAVDFEVTGSGGAKTERKSRTTPVRMYGPGFVTGLDSRQVVRMEPEPGTTNYPPNQFATVEFDAPDLPWLFSPVSDDTVDDEVTDPTGRGFPWCCLVVLERSGDLTIEPAGSEKPLPTVKTDVEPLPPVDEAWAWAHAQVVGSPQNKSEQTLAEAFGEGSTLTRSRLVSPRRLRPNTRYLAGVVPTFEAGVKAGRGMDVATDQQSTTMDLAWNPSATSAKADSPSRSENGSGDGTVTLPLYHYWEFSTGKKGDFEYLARRLEPRNLSADRFDIGYEEIDVTDPGVASLRQPEASRDERTVKLGGALRNDGSSADTYAMREDLRSLLNAPPKISTVTGESYEAVAPPLYGGPHAQVESLTSPEPADQQWLWRLNLHPGFRLAAAVGGDVVRENQEQLMRKAWEQVGEIREVNRTLAFAQLSRAAMETATRDVENAPTGWRVQFTEPMHDRVLLDGRTAGAHLESSSLPAGFASPPLRRLLSGSGRLADRLDSVVDAGALLETVADPSVAVTTPSDAPDGTGRAADEFDLAAFCRSLPEPEDEREDIPRDEEVERLLADIGDVEDRCETLLDELDELARALDVDLLDDLFGGRLRDLTTVAREIRRVTDAGADGDDLTEIVNRATTRWDNVSSAVNDLRDPMLEIGEREEAEDLPTVESAFTRNRAEVLHERLMATTGGPILDYDSRGGSGTGDDGDPLGDDDVSEARSLVYELLDGLADVRRYFDVGGGSDEAYLDTLCEDLPESKTPTPPDLDGVADALDPVEALVDRVDARVEGLDLSERSDPLDRVMAYPKFPDPTYRDLKSKNPDRILPGVSNVPKNTFGALETNPQFIESFLVGMNYEMASELLWRRFPTDIRGSYFRQFWDQSARLPKPPKDEQLKDVTELHTWDDKGERRTAPSVLGSNVMTGAGSDANPEAGRGPTPNSQVVVIVRGKLLQRYPQTTIYAAKAKRVDRSDGPGTARVPEWPSTEQTQEEVDSTYLRFPIFRGRLDPDITFLGFDLTSREATGETETKTVVENPTEETPTDDEGWFFVMEESPGEVRFGLDVNQGDIGDRPNGVTYSTNGDTSVEKTGQPADEPEHGWSGLSWGHLVSGASDLESMDNVSVFETRPGVEEWKTTGDTPWVKGEEGEEPRTEVEEPLLEDEEAATWALNGAHMAYITWQRPVRIAIHADDLLPGGDATPEDE